MNGILIIDKPVGITSHDVVARARRILQTKRIGHTGTLDPFATGVIVLLAGQATRLAQFLDRDAKEYEAIVRLGFETGTGDREGEPRITNYELRDVSVEEIENVLKNFRGEILQTPPMYSAKKIAGKKLYELARQGIEIERKPVAVVIYKLEMTTGELRKQTGATRLENFSDFGLSVSCSAGTYIRTLAEDIGRTLNTGAHLAALRRKRAGKFSIENSITLDALEKAVGAGNLEKVLIPMNEAVAHLPEIRLSDASAARIKNGSRLNVDLTEIADGEFVRLTAGEDLLAVGVYGADEKTVQPKVVLL